MFEPGNSGLIRDDDWMCRGWAFWRGGLSFLFWGRLFITLDTKVRSRFDQRPREEILRIAMNDASDTAVNAIQSYCIAH